MFDIFNTQSDKDLSNDRTLKLDNNTVHIRKSDPYGFWSISMERGQIPHKLKGHYTSFTEAEKAIMHYLNEKGREVKEVSK